jgi:hypothetical protein
MAMTSYNGPATLVDDTHEIAVQAHLVSDQQPGSHAGWGGFVKCDPHTLVPLLGATMTLRLPDGAEGTVVVMGGGTIEGSASPRPSRTDTHRPTATDVNLLAQHPGKQCDAIHQ